MQVKQYLTKPSQVEAVLVEAIWFPNIAIWCNGTVSEYYLKDELVKCIEYRRHGETMIAKVNDYIVKDSDGQFLTVSDELFRYNYTEV